MTAPSKTQAIKLVTALLYAKRNGNVKAEQRAHERLSAWCARHNVNMDNAIEGTRRLLAQSPAAIMNGLTA